MPEKDFVIPGEAFTCNDTRRNYSDLQETAQWLGGSSVPKAILGALTGRVCIEKNVQNFSMFQYLLNKKEL